MTDIAPPPDQAVAEFLERLAEVGRTLHEQMAILAVAMVEAMRPFMVAARQLAEFIEAHPEFVGAMREAAREIEPGPCKCSCLGQPAHECTGEATVTLTLDSVMPPGGALVLPVCDGCRQARLDAVVAEDECVLTADDRCEYGGCVSRSTRHHPVA